MEKPENIEKPENTGDMQDNGDVKVNGDMQVCAMGSGDVKVDGDMQVKTMNNVDLDEMLQKSFWKDILYEIVSAMDPWDIDITELASRYAKNVEQMEEMNFKIPANVVIVSSVLLRMKSQMMSFTDADYDPRSEEWMEDYEMALEGADFIMGQDTESPGSNGGGNGDELLNLAVRPKRVPKRRLTALELISAIQEVLDDRVVREKIRETNRSKETKN